MQLTTHKKHVARARRHVDRKRGKLSGNEKLLGFIDRHKMELSREDRRVALGIMNTWVKTGFLSYANRATLQLFRRQLRNQA